MSAGQSTQPKLASRAWRALIPLVAVGVAAAVPAAGPAAPRPGAPKPATLAKELTRLGAAVSKSQALPGSNRRPLARHPRAAAKAVRAKQPCPAASSLLRLHRGIDAVARRSKGARSRSLRKLQARGARDRQLVLRLVVAGRACGGSAAFSVDTTLKPAAKALPKLAGVKRPLARVAGAYGGGADFVADEVIVSTDSRSTVAAFVARWRGKLLQSVDVPAPGPDQHLIRIDTSRAKPAALAATAQRLSKTRGTDTRVSNETGLGAIAAAAAETAKGLQVGLDFVGVGGDHAGGFTIEAESGPGGWNVASPSGAWTSNAHDWEHLSGSGPIATGVAPAWQLLAQWDRLTPRSVGLAVLDMGFDPVTNGDMGAPLTAVSNVPTVDALGTRNLSSCTAGTPCPWHGTEVSNAAMAATDNGSGAAGPAGPVARPIVVFTLYDMFTSITAVTSAVAAGARVINMSYGVPIPAILAWSAHPFEITTTIARVAGVMLFAAAGNDSTDVDTEDCVVVCWEETLFTPCENLGVTCVGALQGGGTAPACYSNWGSDGVDLWAPGNVLVGRTPAAGADGVHLGSGTSVASPWTAGVAALGWAANPSTDALLVEVALRGRTRAGGFTDRKCPKPDGSPGDSVDRHQATRIVNANAFVRDLLPPQFRIAGPANGSAHHRGVPVAFSSRSFDDDLGAPAITWRRTGDPTPLGAGPSLSRSDLPYGDNEITATAVFPGGPTITDSVRVTITNDAPAVAITAPQAGDSFFVASIINLHGTSSDVNEPDSHLTDIQVSWYLDNETTPFAFGHDATVTGLSPGQHTLHFRGSDGQATASDAVAILVSPNSANLPPTVDILSPANNTQYVLDGPGGAGYKDVTFTTTASDPESGGLAYAWAVSVNGGAFTPIAPRSGTLQNPTFRLREQTTDVCNVDTYDVRLTVTDPANNTAVDQVRIRLAPAPC